MWGFPILEGLNRFAMASCGLFTAALIVLGLIAIVRRILASPDPVDGDAGSKASGLD